MKKAYFIGIAGKTMAPLAKAFKDMGWQVSGSDKEEVYPPITDFLSRNNIAYFKGYREENLPLDSDLVIVGRSPFLTDEENPEYKKAVSSNLTVLSCPEVLNKYLIKENSIVVAGTYGKSTTAALISWILINAGLNPSFMIGGIPVNFSDGTKITDSKYSVVEGDETPSLTETTPPKFMFYKPKYLLITATEYDHPEVYKTKDSYVEAFIALVKLLPGDGLLIYDEDTVDERVVNACRCRKISYSASSGTVRIGGIFRESALRAAVLCQELKIDQKIIEDSIFSFKGLKERNEFLGEFGGRLLYQDLSQQPSKVRNSLSALREQYPKNRIIVVFNPSATSMKYRENLELYKSAFLKADGVIVTKVVFLKDTKERVTGADLVGAIVGGPKDVFYEPIYEKVILWLEKNTREGDIVVFMSSGGLEFTELIKSAINELKD